MSVVHDKLHEIIDYYINTYMIMGTREDIINDLINNKVEVKGDSFYCPIWNDDLGGWILLAGTKSKADIWVLKRIISLIKSGDKIYTIFNGNEEYLISKFKRYNMKIDTVSGTPSLITFN